jgi:hypothetical protein
MFELGITWGLPLLLWTLQGLCLLIWWSEPVFYIPEQWFGPLTSWLKFPFAPLGSCGVFYWWSALKSLVDRSTILARSIKNKSL